MACFRAQTDAERQHLSAKSSLPGGTRPIRQGCGTIDVRSSGDIITSGED